ncbi:hypothetical protein ANO11243_093540 [Dothideomycetidae sp. 11243]|nr:hypothetical protein ANO11243_093540 [fungal sp. No.11243]
MSAPPQSQLSQADINHFLENGYVKIPSCFSRSSAADLTSTLWTRLGVSPRMLPRSVEPQFGADGNLVPDQKFYINLARKYPSSAFVELTGELGDVFLMHPLMLHGASRNALRKPRIITNPPIALRQPFELDRPGGRGYSIVEQKTLRDLGRQDGLKGWKITAERERLVPDRIRKHEQMLKEEAKRLAAAKT